MNSKWFERDVLDGCLIPDINSGKYGVTKENAILFHDGCSVIFLLNCWTSKKVQK